MSPAGFEPTIPAGEWPRGLSKINFVDKIWYSTPLQVPVGHHFLHSCSLHTLQAVSKNTTSACPPLSCTADTQTTEHLTRRSRIIQTYWRITEATLLSKATHPQIRLSLPPPNKIFISCPTAIHRTTHVRASTPEHCKLKFEKPKQFICSPSRIPKDTGSDPEGCCFYIP